MPELPEVETVRRSLAVLLSGRRITECLHLDWPRTIAAPVPEQFRVLVQDRAIREVERRAKYLIIQLDGGDALVVHLRMTGQLTVQPPETVPDSHTHLVLALDNGQRLHFRDARKFGRIWLLSADDLRLLHRRLGPEPLDDALTAVELALVLSRRKGTLKSTLLNQEVLAGLGNIYVDEALWLARLHPLRTIPSLKPEELERLGAAIQTVLRDAIEHRGTTFGQYVDGAGQPGSNQYHLQVYGRAGKPCSRCGTSIEKMQVAQRGTHFCPLCQPQP